MAERLYRFLRKVSFMEKIILFDLDGTLTDPKEGITQSVRYALNSFGIEENNMDRLCSFIGPPLAESFSEYYGFGESDIKKAIASFREYFEGRGMFENQVYPGIESMLAMLCRTGFTLAVATSKPERFAEQILKHFGLFSYFRTVGGADMEETRVKKADVIKHTLGRLNADPAHMSVIMAGDKKHDVLGAAAHGIPCVGVLYGYGSKEELNGAGAAYLAENVEALGAFLMSGEWAR